MLQGRTECTYRGSSRYRSFLDSPDHHRSSFSAVFLLKTAEEAGELRDLKKKEEEERKKKKRGFTQDIPKEAMVCEAFSVQFSKLTLVGTESGRRGRLSSLPFTEKTKGAL